MNSERRAGAAATTAAPPCPGKGKQELRIAQPLYDRFRETILGRTGLLFGEPRKNALRKGLRSMAAVYAGGNLDAYHRQLIESRTDSEIWDELIEVLTVGETHFFRDRAQMDVLHAHVLPDIIRRHRSDRRLRLWSAGCASGEEPYTLAILLDQLLGDFSRWQITIRGTDINRAALRKAKRGLFRSWSFRQTPISTIRKYFTEDGDEYRIDPRIAQRVSFGYLNLNETGYPALATDTQAMDLILFRNVAIYHSESMVRQIVDRFYESLQPGGWLVVGAVETALPVFERFAPRHFSGVRFFRKEDAACNPPAGEPAPRIETGSAPPSRAPLTITRGANRAGSVSPAAASSCPADRKQPGGPAGGRDRPNAGPGGARDDASPLQTARALADRGQMADAAAHCMKAIEATPLDAEAHLLMGLIHQETGDFEQAAARFKKAIFLEPDFALAHFSLANLYRKMGLSDLSVKHRRQVIHLVSGLPEQTVLLGSEEMTAGHLLSMAKTAGG